MDRNPNEWRLPEEYGENINATLDIQRPGKV